MRRRLTNRTDPATISPMAQSVYEKTMQRALRLLSYKPRTVAELRERLREKEWAEEEAVEQVIARLRELNDLNDEEYAANFAATRLQMKPLGRSRLRRDLQRKKLSSPTIEQAVSDAYAEKPEEGLIDEALEKRIRLKGPPATREESAKLIAYLLRRGFSYDLVLQKVNEAQRNAKEEIGME